METLPTFILLIVTSFEIFIGFLIFVLIIYLITAKNRKRSKAVTKLMNENINNPLDIKEVNATEIKTNVCSIEIKLLLDYALFDAADDPSSPKKIWYKDILALKDFYFNIQEFGVLLFVSEHGNNFNDSEVQGLVHVTVAVASRSFREMRSAADIEPLVMKYMPQALRQINHPLKNNYISITKVWGKI